MEVRFEVKVTRGFSLSPRSFRDSLSPLRRLLLLLSLSRRKIKKNLWDQGKAMPSWSGICISIIHTRKLWKFLLHPNLIFRKKNHKRIHTSSITFAARFWKHNSLVLQHCCKTSWIAILCVLPSTLQPVSQQKKDRFAVMWQNKLHVFCCPFYRVFIVLRNNSSQLIYWPNLY